MKLENLKLNEISPVSSPAIQLTNELFLDLEEKYGKGSLESFTNENSTFVSFLVIYDEEKKPIACGALKHFNKDTSEIKRMYVKPGFRGKGLSKIILTRLEEAAQVKNYKRIILETGLKQPEAISLYGKSNYKKIKCYGKYANDPDSICFEKKLI